MWRTDLRANVLLQHPPATEHADVRVFIADAGGHHDEHAGDDMRTVIIIMLVSLTGCAGITLNTQHNEMWKSDAGGEAPSFSLELGPPARALSKLEPADVKEVLMAYADSLGRLTGLNFEFMQSIGSEIVSEGKIAAEVRAQLAKELQNAGGLGTSGGTTTD